MLFHIHVSQSFIHSRSRLFTGDWGENNQESGVKSRFYRGISIPYPENRFFEIVISLISIKRLQYEKNFPGIIPVDQWGVAGQ